VVEPLKLQNLFACLP